MNSRMIIIGSGESGEDALERILQMGCQAILVKDINSLELEPQLTDLITLAGKYTSPVNNLTIIKKIGEKYIKPSKKKD